MQAVKGQRDQQQTKEAKYPGLLALNSDWIPFQPPLHKRLTELASPGIVTPLRFTPAWVAIPPPHFPSLHAVTKNLCQFGGLCGVEIKCEDYPTGLICWQQVCPIDVLCWSSQLTNYFFPKSWFEVFAGYNFHTH